MGPGHHFHHAQCHSPLGGGRGGYGRPFPGRDFGHRGGRPRMFEQGDLRFVVLQLLGEKPAHGYEIIRAVEDRLGGAYAPSPGIVYPTLTLLEEQGFIAVVETDGPRKLYGLTPAGRDELDRSAADIERVFARMSEVRQRMGGATAPEIGRAVENLRTAIRLRLERRDSAEVVNRLTAILDSAARAVEDL